MAAARGHRGDRRGGDGEAIQAGEECVIILSCNSTSVFLSISISLAPLESLVVQISFS